MLQQIRGKEGTSRNWELKFSAILQVCNYVLFLDGADCSPASKNEDYKLIRIIRYLFGYITPAKPTTHPGPSKTNFLGKWTINLFVLLSGNPGVLLGTIT
jgi:hypothetical protein